MSDTTTSNCSEIVENELKILRNIQKLLMALVVAISGSAVIDNLGLE